MYTVPDRRCRFYVRRLHVCTRAAGAHKLALASRNTSGMRMRMHAHITCKAANTDAALPAPLPAHGAPSARGQRLRLRRRHCRRECCSQGRRRRQGWQPLLSAAGILLLPAHSSQGLLESKRHFFDVLAGPMIAR